MSTSEKSETVLCLANRTSGSAKRRGENRNYKSADAKRVNYFAAGGEAAAAFRVQGSLTWAPNLLDGDSTSCTRPLSAAEYIHSLHPVASFTPLKYGKMSDLDIHIASCLEHRDGHRDLLAETMERMARVRENNERLKLESQRLKALIRERAARTIQIYWRLYRERLKEQRKQEKRKKSTWMETVRARRPPPTPRGDHSLQDNDSEDEDEGEEEEEEEEEQNGGEGGAGAEGGGEGIRVKTKKKKRRKKLKKKLRAEAAESPPLSPGHQESGAGENIDGATDGSKKSSKKKTKKLRRKSLIKGVEVAPLDEDAEAGNEGAEEVPTEEVSLQAASMEGEGGSKPSSRRGKRKKGGKTERKSRRRAAAMIPHAALIPHASVDSDDGRDVLARGSTAADMTLHPVELGTWGGVGPDAVPFEVGLDLTAGDVIVDRHGKSGFSEASTSADDEYENGDEEECIYEDDDETEEERDREGEGGADGNEDVLAEGKGELKQAEQGAQGAVSEEPGDNGTGTHDWPVEAAGPVEESPPSALHAESPATPSNEATISGSGSAAVAMRPTLRLLPVLQPLPPPPQTTAPAVAPVAAITGNETVHSSGVRARSRSASPIAKCISAFQTPLPEAAPKPRRAAYRPRDAAQLASRPAPRGSPAHAPPELRGATSQGASHHALMPLQGDARNIPSLLRVYDPAPSVVSPNASMAETAPGSQADFTTLPVPSTRPRAVSGNGYFTSAHSPTFYQLLSPRLAMVRTGSYDDGSGSTCTGGGSEHHMSILLGGGSGARSVMSAQRANGTNLPSQHSPQHRARSSNALIQHVDQVGGRPKWVSADAAATAAGAGVPDSVEGAAAAATSLALNSPSRSDSATTSSLASPGETLMGGPEPVLPHSRQRCLPEPQTGLWPSLHHGTSAVIPLITTPSPGHLGVPQVATAVAANRQVPPGPFGLVYPLVSITDEGATTVISGGSQSAPASPVRGAIIDAQTSLVSELLSGVKSRSAVAAAMTCRYVHYGRHDPLRKHKSAAAKGRVAQGRSSSGRGRARGRLQANGAALGRGDAGLSIVTLGGREGPGQGHASGEVVAGEPRDLAAEFSGLSLRSQATAPLLESERSAPALLQWVAPSRSGLPFRYRRDVLRQVFSQAQIHPAELMQRAMTPPRGVRGRTMVSPHPTLSAGAGVAAKQHDLTHIDLLDQAQGLVLLHHSRRKMPRRSLIHQAQLQQQHHRRPHQGLGPISPSSQPRDGRTRDGDNNSGNRSASCIVPLAGGQGDRPSGLRDTDEHDSLGVVLEVGRQLAAREEAERYHALQQPQQQQQQHYQHHLLHHQLSQQQQVLMSDGVNRWQSVDFEPGLAPGVGIVQGKGQGPSVQPWTMSADSCAAGVEGEGLRSGVAGSGRVGVVIGTSRETPRLLQPQLPLLPLTNIWSRSLGGALQTVGSGGGGSSRVGGGETMKHRLSSLPSFSSNTPSLGISGASMLVPPVPPLGPDLRTAHTWPAPLHDEPDAGAAVGTSPTMPCSSVSTVEIVQLFSGQEARPTQPPSIQHTLRPASSVCSDGSGSEKGTATDQVLSSGPFTRPKLEITLHSDSPLAYAITPAPTRSISPSAVHNQKSVSRPNAPPHTIFWATSQLPHLRTTTSKHIHPPQATSPHSQAPLPPPQQQEQHLGSGQLQEHLAQLLHPGEGNVPIRLLLDMNSKTQDVASSNQFGDLLAPTPWLQRVGGSNDAGTATVMAAAPQPSRPVSLPPVSQLIHSTSARAPVSPPESPPSESTGPAAAALMSFKSSDGFAVQARGRPLSGGFEASSRHELFSETQPPLSKPGHVQQAAVYSPSEAARFEGLRREASSAGGGGLPSVPPPTITTRLVVRRPAPVLRLPVLAASQAAQRQQQLIQSHSKLSTYSCTDSGALFTSGSPSGSFSGATVSRATALTPAAASCDGILTLPTEQASYVIATPPVPPRSYSPEPYLLTMSTGMAQSGASVSICGGLGASSPEPWKGQPSLPQAVASHSLNPSYTTHSVLLFPEASRASCGVDSQTSPGASGTDGGAGSKAALREWRGLERWWQAKGLGESAGQFHKQPLTHTTRTVYL